MTTVLNSLGDYIVDRTESLDDSLIQEYFIERSDDKIKRLLDTEQYLLEGSRGSGKTMLMKSVELLAKNTFGQNSVLAVWVSFEESIRIERIKVVNTSLDPFLQWTMGKILYEVLEHIIKLKPASIERLEDRLTKIFGSNNKNNYSYYAKILSDYIQVLEKGDIEDNSSLGKNVPSIELVNILENPTSFKNFLVDLIKDFHLERIVLLFDEAAHVFSFSQQEKFFTLFKALRHPKIACKAAVYPGITNYGKYFEKGQDAKELRLDWAATNLEDLNYIKDILKVRIQKFDLDYWNKLTVNKAVIDIICACSNGNPRFSFHIIDELQNSRAFSKAISIPKVIAALRTVFDSKWKEFSTLKQRLVKYRNYIEAAEDLMKEVIIPNLREWNNKQRKNSKKLSAGFYVSTTLYDQVPQLFDILAYSNIIMIDYSKKSLGKNQHGYYMALNPSLLFTDLILRDISEMNNVSTNKDTNQAYYPTSPGFKELIENLKDGNEYQCSNSKCDYKTADETFAFCPRCGHKIQVSEGESLYKILRSHSIDNLRLSPKIIERLKFKFVNIGEVYDAELDDLRMKYIQDVRIEMIKNAAIEYMAG
ncbi:hypothetical protein [Brevibacillus brevis]|uniref:ORC-CDC6 family AAA ATPase n=1 Tax=Brevibacillus brevis TaxID=1393 RepID=UPI001C8EACA6|nr:hypothetical protein [Brevibacillus brevis]MBY0086542.1 hypothetical protein [Brevibacillus brevis]UKK99764.1 hypothetical protein FO446_21085 [Brevibacillus brevis]